MSRKIDALVAEHVMGLEVSPDEDQDPRVAHYSTNIVAAWGVIDVAFPYTPGRRDYDDRWFRMDRDERGWTAGWCGCEPFEGDYFLYHTQVTANTAPMAICLAALKAKEIEVPDEGDAHA